MRLDVDTRIYVIGDVHSVDGMKAINVTRDSFKAIGFRNVIAQQKAYAHGIANHMRTMYPFQIRLHKDTKAFSIEEYYSFFQVLRKIKGRREDKNGVIITRAGAKLQRDILEQPVVFPTMTSSSNLVSLNSIPIWPLARGSVTERIMPSYGLWIQPEMAWHMVNRACKPNRRLNKGNMKSWGWDPIAVPIEKYLYHEIRDYYDNFMPPRIFKDDGIYAQWHYQVRLGFRSGFRTYTLPINVHGL